MKIQVVNLRSVPNAVRVDRRTALGNPFVIGRDGDREAVIEKYRQWLWIEIRKPIDQSAASRFFHELVGKAIIDNGLVLGCWCKPQACHADVLARATIWKVNN